VKLKININKKIVDPKALKPHPENYNIHPDGQISELGKSLRQFGQYKNIVVWRGYILAGHGMVKAAIREKMTEVEINDISQLTENDAKKLLVADNLSAEGSQTDMDLLKNLLDSINDISIPGLDVSIVDELDILTGLIESIPEKEVQIKPYKQVHILLSFDPIVLADIEPYLKKIKKTQGVEYEQAAN